MKLKLSKESKLDLINKFFKGEKASDLAKRYNISKVLFYKYLDRYKKYGVKGLEEGKPGRKRKPRNAHVQMPSKSLTPLERFRMVQEVTEEGKAISEVAKKYQVSRNTLYKWIDRYKKSEKERINKVYDKERIVGRYYNQTPEFYNEAVLNLVEKHPEYGINKLVENLPKFGHKPILGYHGVQNILRRNDLSTYDRRAAFAQTKVTAVNSTITGILKHVERFFRIVPAIRSKIVKAGLIVFLSIFSIIVISGFIQAIDKPFRDLDGFTIVGGIFALISLFAGTFFFLYSLKYYLTIALVLSYAQTDFFGKDSEAKRKGFLNWLLGITNGTNGNVRDLSNPDSIQSNTPVGLEPNLEHVILKRFPFISVHIPFYNEKNVVERAIKAATSFDYPGDYEVILCDDSTDETTQIIRGYMHESGSANNIFDADFVPYPDTLELFMKYFQAQAGTLEFQGNSDYQYNTNTNLRRLTDTDDSGVSGNTTNNQTQTQAYAQTQTTAVKSSIAAVCGYQWHVLNKSENWITRGVRTEYAGSYVIERSGQEILGAFKQIHGSVYAIRRDVLEEVGWETSITEDFELTLKLYDAGYKVVYTPYIQAPAECVSTLKRLIRQRMRWAEGHSFNVKKMWKRLLFGKWVDVVSTSTPINSNNYQYQVSENIQPQTAGHRFGIGSSSKRFIPSPLTPMEKLEFIYLSPYYLQAFFFLLGTFSWLISETIFRVHLPFWTELWGWSLVLTNMISLPLMNAVGMFLEESEER
ncbi:MAG: Glycosyl transferase family 2, partial [Candidatus Woesebacteria bacterium GW2011_GWB1_38_8b]